MRTMRAFFGLEEFVETASCGNFSKAAERLGVSKSLISTRVAQLEQQLGIRLLERTTRSVTLTQEGTHFLAQGKKILDSWNQLKTDTSKHDGPLAGNVRMTLCTPFGDQYVLPLLLDAMREFPNLKIQAHFTNEIVPLEDQNIDIAVRFSVQPENNYISIPLWTTDMVICAHPDVIKEEGKPIQPRDLSGRTCLTYGQNNTIQDWILFGAGGSQIVRISGRWSTNSMSALVEAGLKGLGWIWVPRLYVQTYLETGKLTEVLPAWTETPVSLWLVAQKRNGQKPVVSGLLHKIESAFTSKHS